MTGTSNKPVAIFELTVFALDKPTVRKRWNGGPMPSAAADAALQDAVDAFKAAVEEHGLTVARSSYGVRAAK